MTQALIVPHAEPPAPGTAIQVAEGILWLRLPLPYRLDHVNVYLIEDHGGWAVVDTGLATDECRSAWETVLRGPLRDRRLTRLIVTHHHPDHMGLAGWLADRHGVGLEMPRTEYLFGLLLQRAPISTASDAHRDFYRRHSLSADQIERILGSGHGYLRRTSVLPPTYRPIVDGDRLAIGGRVFEVLTGGGHAFEQAMLSCAEGGLLLAADQVIARISPNVSVQAMEPDADVLGVYLASLQRLRVGIAADVLVLPGHGLPFYGLWQRIDELTRHHAERCDIIARACAPPGLSVSDLVPHVFARALDDHQMGFAVGEVLAHVNLLIAAGRLNAIAESTGTRFSTITDATS